MMLCITLDRLKPGSRCVIKRITANGSLDQRLMDFGFYPGIEIKIIRNAPLGDPMKLEINSRFLSIRRDEARFVEVCP